MPRAPSPEPLTALTLARLCRAARQIAWRHCGKPLLRDELEQRLIDRGVDWLLVGEPTLSLAGRLYLHAPWRRAELERLSRHRRKRHGEELLRSLPAPATGGAAAPQAREAGGDEESARILAELEPAIARLTPLQARVLLGEVEDVSLSETARQLGRDTSQLRRCRECAQTKMQDFFGKDGPPSLSSHMEAVKQLLADRCACLRSRGARDASGRAAAHPRGARAP